MEKKDENGNPLTYWGGLTSKINIPTSIENQTAVEWLLNQMDLETISKYDKQLLQAKEMEKQQIIDAYINGIHSDCMSHEDSVGYANKYYNETFNK